MKNQSLQMRYNQRAFKDRLVRYFVASGGISVIIAILLIFFYLLYVVVPMFSSAEIHESTSFEAPGVGATIHLGLEEQGTLAVRFTDDGHIIFFDTSSGNVVKNVDLELPATITSSSATLNTVVLGLENGKALAVRYKFDLSYPGDVRTLTPRLEYPLGQDLLVLDKSAQALTDILVQMSDDTAGLAGVTADKRIVFSRYAREESFLSGEITTELESNIETSFDGIVNAITLTPDLNHMYVAIHDGDTESVLSDYLIGDDGFDEDIDKYTFEQKILRLKLLLGGSSLLVGLENGEVQQWMSVRTDKGRELAFIRNFISNLDDVASIATEQQRKGFSVSDTNGNITLYYSTSQRTLAAINTADKEIVEMTWSARAQHLLAADAANRLYLYEVDNEYP
jgi:phosphate transport system permease protein